VAVDRRREKRHQKIVLVRYSDERQAEAKQSGFFKFAITTNISDSGLAFRSLQPFDVGTPLTFLSDDMWESSRKGDIRWCSEAVPGVYICGVALH
jgi:hypothetical protein